MALYVAPQVFVDDLRSDQPVALPGHDGATVTRLQLLLSMPPSFLAEAGEISLEEVSMYRPRQQRPREII